MDWKAAGAGFPLVTKDEPGQASSASSPKPNAKTVAIKTTPAACDFSSTPVEIGYGHGV